MDNEHEQPSDIVDEFVVFNDDTPEEAGQTRVIPVNKIIEELTSTEEKAPVNYRPESEKNVEEPSAYKDSISYNEDAYEEEYRYYNIRNRAVEYDEDTYEEPEDIEYDFDFEHDYQEADTRLVIPMIKPILKRLIPVLLIILVVIWAMTSENFMVRNYRQNFVQNIKHIGEKTGLTTPGKIEEEEVPKENYAEGLMEYKEEAKEIEEGTDGGNEQQVQYRTGVASDVMITHDGAASAQFVKYREGVILASTNYLSYINKDGVVEWEKNIAITDPILRSEGDYYIVAQKNGNKFTLYSGEKAIYDRAAEYNILNGNVSSDGDVVLVTEKPGYKGAVSVYNKRGDNAFSWSSGGASVISADISASSRRVAAALLNTDGKAKSSVCLFDLNKSDSYARQDFDETIVYKVDFKDEMLNVFADNALIGMKTNGKISYKIDYGDSEATRAALADNGDKLVLFTGTNMPMMNIYNKNGKLKNTISSQKVPGYAYIYDDNIIYNVDREIIVNRLGTKIPYKYTAVMDIKGLVPIDNRSFMVIYSNSVSMVRMKGVLW